jgi:hypothetical protein
MDLVSIRLPKGMIEELDRYTEKLREGPVKRPKRC